jgi:hypothetical protein
MEPFVKVIAGRFLSSREGKRYLIFFVISGEKSMENKTVSILMQSFPNSQFPIYNSFIAAR